MRQAAHKLAFVHRILWQRDHVYRWAVLLGPPPLLGGAMALLGWSAVQHMAIIPGIAEKAAPWAHWSKPVERQDQPFAEATSAALPQTDAAGHFVGFETGWVAAIQPFTVDATMDANVLATVTGRFIIGEPNIPLSRILDAGPPTGLFVGVARTYFVVRQPGLYAFSIRLMRSGTVSANCIVRFGSAHHRMLRDIELNAMAPTERTFQPTAFLLKPGLLILAVATGCWRGDQMVGSGDVTVLVRHPWDTDLKPAAADELVRPIAAPGHGAGDSAASRPR